MILLELQRAILNYKKNGFVVVKRILFPVTSIVVI